MKETIKVAISLALCVPFVATIAALNVVINIVGWTAWFVLPFGAVIVGWGGTLGFSIVEFFTRNRSSSAAILASMATGLLALIVTYWVKYTYEAWPGETIGEFLSDIANSPIRWSVEIKEHSAGFESPGLSLLGWLALIPQPIGALVGGAAGVAAAPKWPSLWLHRMRRGT